MSVEIFIKSTTQKHSASVKNSELFNNNCSKWKQFKQAVNNKLHHNINHYLNYDNKIDYIDSYLNDKINYVLNHKQNSNNHLNFKIYSNLLSYFNKYYQNYLQNKINIKKWEILHIKYNDQFSVFWVEFTTLIHKIKALFDNMSKQLVNLFICQFQRKYLNQLTKIHLIVNYDSQNLNQLSQFYK